MIITKGYGGGSLITKGYGGGSLITKGYGGRSGEILFISQYFKLLTLLLPFGCYTQSEDSTHVKDLLSHAISLDTCQLNADALRTEIYPDLTAALLPAWERVYSLIQADKTGSERRQNLVAVINMRGGLAKSYIQAVVKPFVGYDVAVDEYKTFRADDPESLTDSGLYAIDPDYVFYFKVKIDPAQVQTAGYDLVAIQAIVDRVKPAHTTGEVIIL